MGAKTVNAINSVLDQDQLLQDIALIRRQYYNNLAVQDVTQIANLKGWLNRANDCLQVNI
jgi:hypothetical protein